MSKGNQGNYSGQTIFIGIDVHKKNWAVCGILDGKLLFAESKNPDPDELMRSLGDRFPNAEFSIAYEAGFCGFGIVRRLKELGAKCIVVNAADIPTSDKDRKRKTDKRDARNIALELSKGHLTPVYTPESDMESIRGLTRYRGTLVKERTCAINRIKHFFHYYSINIGEEIKQLNKRVIAQMRAFDTGNGHKTKHLHYLLDVYEQLNSWITKLKTEIQDLSRTQPELKKTQPVLQSIPGIGLITAMTIQTEIGDMKRFKSADQLCSYAGLVPDINSSGDRSSRCGMTNRCNKYIRKLLTEASWSAIKWDDTLKEKYHTYRLRMNANKAIIRIAKHLLLRIRSVWLSGKPYQKDLTAANEHASIAA